MSSALGIVEIEYGIVLVQGLTSAKSPGVEAGGHYKQMTYCENVNVVRDVERHSVL